MQTGEIEESFQISENPTAIIISQDPPICKIFFCFYCIINREIDHFVLCKINIILSHFKIFLKPEKVCKKRY